MRDGAGSMLGLRGRGAAGAPGLEIAFVSAAAAGAAVAVGAGVSAGAGSGTATGSAGFESAQPIYVDLERRIRCKCKRHMFGVAAQPRPPCADRSHTLDPNHTSACQLRKQAPEVLRIHERKRSVDKTGKPMATVAQSAAAVHNHRTPRNLPASWSWELLP